MIGTLLFKLNINSMWGPGGSTQVYPDSKICRLLAVKTLLSSKSCANQKGGTCEKNNNKKTLYPKTCLLQTANVQENLHSLRWCSFVFENASANTGCLCYSCDSNGGKTSFTLHRLKLFLCLSFAESLAVKKQSVTNVPCVHFLHCKHVRSDQCPSSDLETQCSCVR